MAPAKPVTACILIIGNEVLSGRTQDVNLKYLGQNLNAIGIRVAEARIIADDEATIISTLNQCRADNDYVFTTGGIGPTHDDITSECVAQAFGVGMFRDQGVVDLVGVLGYYVLVAMTLNAFEMPLPDGVPLPLAP